MSIHSQRRARTALAGNYGSVFKGRSMDFDDLREYTYGDDVKDIDWKASARSRNVMIKRYVAIRKHNIMIVADSGKAMAALAPSGEKKGDIAVFCASVMSYIAQKHGDLVGCVYGNLDMTKRFKLKESTAHIESFLGHYDKSISLEASDGNINQLLSYVSKTYSERLFLIVITDPASVASLNVNYVRRLGVRHEQMFILIEDSPLTNKGLYTQDARDLDGNLRLPLFFRNNKMVAKAEENYRETQRENIRRNLRRFGVVCSFIDSIDHAIPRIYEMLEEQKHARR
jgi:uncharacterized protein (DUF58 family)